MKEIVSMYDSNAHVMQLLINDVKVKHRKEENV